MFENKRYDGLSKEEKKFFKKTEKLMEKSEKDSKEIFEYSRCSVNSFFTMHLEVS